MEDVRSAVDADAVELAHKVYLGALYHCLKVPHTVKPEQWKNLDEAKKALIDSWDVVAEEYIAAHDCRKAAYVCRKILDLDPDNVVAIANLGTFLCILGDREEGMLLLQRALELQPDKALIYKNAAVILLEDGQRVEGLAALEKAIDLEPDNKEVLASINKDAKDYHIQNEVLAILAAAIQKREGEPCPVLNSAAAGLLLGEHRHKEALPYAEAAVAQAPGEIVCRHDLGLIYLFLDRDSEGHAQFEEALRLDPDDAFSWHAIGWSKYFKGEKAEGLVVLEKAARLNPQNVGYLLDLAWAYKNSGKEEDAISTFRQVLNLDPNDFMALHAMTGILYERDEYQESRTMAERLLTIVPSYAYAYQVHGFCNISLGRPREAAVALRRWTDLDPDNANAWENLGAALVAMKAYPECLFSCFKSATLTFQQAWPVDDEKGKQHKQNPRRPLVVAASIDLKLTADGQVKILEFNDLYSSGFKGFRAVTNLNMIDDVVAPDYEKIEKNFSDKGVELDIFGGYIDKFQRLLHRIEKNESVSLIPNADPGFYALCHFKDYLPLLGLTDLDDYMPSTRVVPLSPAGFKQVDIDGSHLVMKPCNACQGNGVETVRAEDIMNRLARTVRDKIVDDYWHDENAHPNLLVQECIRSKPVKATDGRLYDGTMRVAFTAIRPVACDDFEIVFHGAYWKLPGKEMDESLIDDASLISLSPAKRSDEANAAFAGRPISALVSPEDYETVKKQLEICLGRLLPRACLEPYDFYGYLLDMIRSKDEAQRNLGIVLATTPDISAFLTMTLEPDEMDTLLSCINEAGKNPSAGTFLLELKEKVRRTENPENMREVNAALHRLPRRDWPVMNI